MVIIQYFNRYALVMKKNKYKHSMSAHNTLTKMVFIYSINEMPVFCDE